MRVGIGCQEAGGAGWEGSWKDGVTRHVMGIVMSEFRALRVCLAGESILRELSRGGGESKQSQLPRSLFLQREEFHPNRIDLAVSAPD